MSNREEIIAAGIAQMKELPYSQWISESRMRDYLNDLYDKGEDIKWCLDRHKGIGASEIGYLVADYRNLKRQPGEEFFNSMRSAHEVVVQKLASDITRDEKDAAELEGIFQRGKRLEGISIQILIDQLRQKGHEVEVANDIMEFCAAEHSPHSEYPWLRGNNIDVVLRIDGHTFIADIKCPSAASLAALVNQGGGLEYQAQLHQYKMWLEDKGFKIDGLLIGAFNYQDATVEEIYVEKDLELERDIVRAGEHYWNNHILQGIYPGYVSQYDTVYDPNNVPDEHYALVAKMAGYKAVEEYAAEQFKTAKESLENSIKRTSITESVLFEFGCFTANSKLEEQLNEKEILEAAELVGLDIEKYKGSTKRIWTALKKELPKHPEITRENLVTNEHKVTVRKISKKKPTAELFKAVSEQAALSVEVVAEELKAEQMTVLDVIKDLALDEHTKQEFFKSLPQRQLEEYSHSQAHVIQDLNMEGAMDSKARETSQGTITPDPTTDMGDVEFDMPTIGPLSPQAPSKKKEQTNSSSEYEIEDDIGFDMSAMGR